MSLTLTLVSNKMFSFWIAAVFLFGTVYTAQVCYERLGCFEDTVPWAGTLERPIGKLPWPPERINTNFILYTKQNPNTFQKISALNPSSILTSNYKGNKTTRFIVHGFIDKGDENWLKDMCKLMMQIEDVNCICVDWQGGSRTGYVQSSQNIRVVAAEIVYLIKYLQSYYNQTPTDFHVIGHSLGAHCAGEVGRKIRGLGRITGLDPAEAYFQNTDNLVRLDASDAVFVDVIHTDSAPMVPYLGLGMSQAVGHLDFYPNGGEHMPGCDKNIISQIVDLDGIWEGTRDFVACNHLRSYKYYADSILNPDGFVGYKCNSMEDFVAGKCFPCPIGGCPVMGHHSPTFKVPAGVENMKFYLNTGDVRPFMRWRYRVTVTIIGDRGVSGTLKVSLYGTKGNTRQHEIAKTKLKPGSTYSAYIDTEVDVGEVQKVKFIWDNNQINPLLPKLGAQVLVLQRGKDRQVLQFCGSGSVREEVLQTLALC
ncbi:inactive pancreatic lipase-related protein 1-like [Polyodon spathula]|uniref:inactive pancreatic lipase-related protein 1-like n=1 Tax=Polyodon spathula TaxID=7913 RepID=UPI001B7DFA35|nr:inactive pancreatic lipase-related protein 1-like [Polyodon spathula]